MDLFAAFKRMSVALPRLTSADDGRTCPIRLALAVGSVPYDDIRVSTPEVHELLRARRLP